MITITITISHLWWPVLIQYDVASSSIDPAKKGSEDDLPFKIHYVQGRTVDLLEGKTR